MLLPRMSAAVSVHSPFGDSPSLPEGEGLELAVTYYASASWADCPPGDPNCRNVGCGKGDSQANANMAAVADLRKQGVAYNARARPVAVTTRAAYNACKGARMGTDLDNMFNL